MLASSGVQGRPPHLLSQFRVSRVQEYEGTPNAGVQQGLSLYRHVEWRAGASGSANTVLPVQVKHVNHAVIC